MGDYAFASKDGSPEDLEALFGAPILAFDVESTGVHMRSDVPIGFSVTHSPNSAYYASIDNVYFRELLANPNTLYISHNSKFDRSMMRRVGVQVNKVCDTMIAAHLCEEVDLSLEFLIGHKAGRSIPTFGDIRRPLIDLSLHEMLDYSGSHSRAALILWNGYEDEHYYWPGYEYELRRNLLSKVFWGLETPLIPVLSDMELHGVAINSSYLVELGQYFDEKLELLEQALVYWAGTKINFNSPDQVADLFYRKLGIKPGRNVTNSGRPAVEGKYLESIKNSHTIIPLYLRYKQYQKLKSTYVNSLVEKKVDGRIYGNFNQAATRTGRLSSSDPNLQNIPERTEEGRKIRRAFVAPPGFVLIKVDADQLELKMIAILSKDPALLGAFRAGKDIHEETATRAYGSASRRPDGKTLNYQVIYGGGREDQQQAFFSAYPGVPRWEEKVRQDAETVGYVRTLFGRKRSIPEIRSSNRKLAEHGHRKAISTIVQGSSAEVIKVGMRRVWEDIKNTGIGMVLQVHDELLFEVPTELLPDFASYLGRRLQYDDLDLPITYSISYGPNWAQMTKWNEGRGK